MLYRLLIFVQLVLLGLVELRGQVDFVPIDTSGNECFTSTFLGEEFDGYTGKLLPNVTTGSQPNMCLEDEAENIQWFSFFAVKDTLQFEITFSNCTGGNLADNGFQAGLLKSCDFSNGFLQCEQILSSDGTIIIEVVTEPGLHYLYVDGYGQSICDFEIKAIKGTCDNPLQSSYNDQCDIYFSGTSTDTITVCQYDNSIVNYASNVLPTFRLCDSEASINEITQFRPFFKVETQILGENGGYAFKRGEVVNVSYNSSLRKNYSSRVEIVWNEPGTYQIVQKYHRSPYVPKEVKWELDCFDTLTVNVISVDTVYQDPIRICEGETVEVWGNTYDSDQLVTRPTDDKCGTLAQEIKVISPQTVNLGTQYICEGESFSFGGITYNEGEDYSYKGPNICDTTYLFSVAFYSVDIRIEGGNSISCAAPVSSFTAEVDTDIADELDMYWSDYDGARLSDELMYETSEEGTYYFNVTSKTNQNCSFQKAIVVTKNDDLPSAIVPDYELNCSINTIKAEVNSQEQIASLAWSGPNGFSSDAVTPELTDAGNYEITVLFDNGCELPLSFEVKGDFTEPSATLLVDSLDCRGYGYATYLSTSLADVEWTDGTNILGQDSLFRFEEMGTYSLKLTGSNGCESTYAFEPVDLRHVPTAGLTDEKWLCTTTDISFNLSSQADQTWTVTILEGDISHDAGIVNAQGPGVFAVEVIDNNTSCSGMDTVSILDVREDLGVQLTAYDPSCPGEKDGSVVVDMQKGTAPYSYYLNGQEQELSNLSSGEYTLKVVDANGCEQDTSFRLREALPFEILTDPEIAIRYGQTKMITLEHNLPDSLYQSTLWYVNNNRIASGEEYELSDTLGGILRGVVYDVNGCEQFLDFLISYDNNIDIYIPNIFSPNDDGNNDKWTIKSHFDGLTLDHVEIYDRWGSKVFQHHNVNILNDNIQWDGTLNGAVMPTGSYVYLIQYTQPDGIQKIRKGTISLVR